VTSTPRLVAAVITRLSAQLPTLAAAAAVPAPTEYLDYDPELAQLVKAPQLWVDVVTEDRSNLAAYGAGNAKQARNRIILVAVTAAGPTPSAAAKNLRTLADLVVQAMEGDQSCGGEGWRVQWLGTQYSPNMGQGVTGQLLKLAALKFSIPRWAALGSD
jgi:hypothetical protein